MVTTKQSEEQNIDPALKSVTAVIMRGGTSRGVFFNANDLPDDSEHRDELILSVMGSPDPRQIEGIAGADPLTSKIAIIDTPDDADEADLLYTFGQVHIEKPHIDYTANCGNISSAVGHYAIEEGLIEPSGPTTRVVVRNTNNDILLTNEIEIGDGTYPKVTGEYSISGVPGSGSRINVGFKDTGGEKTGSLYPAGVVEEFEQDGESIPYTVVDATGHPSMFLRADDIGLDGTETPEEIEANDELLDLITEIRAEAGLDTGIVDTYDEVALTHEPVPVLVGEPRPYTTNEGEAVDPDELSLLVRRILDRRVHKAYAGTGAICTVIASQTPGTIVNETMVREFSTSKGRTRITVGHPSGTMDALIGTDEKGREEAIIGRTACRIMDGVAYGLPEKVRNAKRQAKSE